MGLFASWLGWLCWRFYEMAKLQCKNESILLSCNQIKLISSKDGGRKSYRLIETKFKGLELELKTADGFSCCSGTTRRCDYLIICLIWGIKAHYSMIHALFKILSYHTWASIGSHFIGCVSDLGSSDFRGSPSRKS